MDQDGPLMDRLTLIQNRLFTTLMMIARGIHDEESTGLHLASPILRKII